MNNLYILPARFIFLVFFFNPIFSYAQSNLQLKDVASAARHPHEDWQTTRERFRSVFLKYQSLREKKESDVTVEQSAIPYKQIDLNQVEKWNHYDDVLRAFHTIRDIRFLKDSSHQASPFLRRSTWLYPDDGCYARAGMMRKQLKFYHFPRMSRVFIFGNLTVETPNSPYGEITWWYHTAPVMRIDNKTVFVLDPSMNPHQPMNLENWIKKQIKNEDSVQIAFCKAESYYPGSPCNKVKEEEDSSAESDLLSFLEPEWDRQIELGRNPMDFLGDRPPWENHSIQAETKNSPEHFIDLTQK